jgi:hypothetical protein
MTAQEWYNHLLCVFQDMEATIAKHRLDTSGQGGDYDGFILNRVIDLDNILVDLDWLKRQGDLPPELKGDD